MVMLKVSAILYLLLALVALVFLSIAQYSHDVPPPVYLDSPSNVELLSFSKRRTATTSGGSIGTIKRKQKYQLAYDESLGYFDDLDETHWERLREAAIARLQSIRTYRPKMMDWMTPMSFYEYFEPDFVCPFERRLGSNEIGDGPKWICDPHRLERVARERRQELNDGVNADAAAPGCLVYSIGSNGDFSFEESIEQFVGEGVCEIHTFDPEPKYADQAPDFVHYHAWGLKASYPPPANAVLEMTSQFELKGDFKTMQETTRLLGHDKKKNGRVVDLFKIDCEGCEWISYRDWIGGDATIEIRQLLIELHEHPDVGYEFFESLLREGYVLFHKEPNPFAPRHHGFGVEHSFLKLRKDFRLIEGDLVPSRGAAGAPK